MTIDFNTLLTAEQKRSILTQRIAQFAAEGYQHQLNLQVAESIGNAEAAATCTESMAQISAAIQVNQAELDSLPTE